MKKSLIIKQQTIRLLHRRILYSVELRLNGPVA